MDWGQGPSVAHALLFYVFFFFLKLLVVYVVCADQFQVHLATGVLPHSLSLPQSRAC